MAWGRSSAMTCGRTEEPGGHRYLDHLTPPPSIPLSVQAQPPAPVTMLFPSPPSSVGICFPIHGIRTVLVLVYQTMCFPVPSTALLLPPLKIKIRIDVIQRTTAPQGNGNLQTSLYTGGAIPRLPVAERRRPLIIPENRLRSPVVTRPVILEKAL